MVTDQPTSQGRRPPRSHEIRSSATDPGGRELGHPVSDPSGARLADRLETGSGAQREARPLVALLNHHRDPLDDLARGLAAAGFETVSSGSLAETHRVLQQSGRPAVVVLNPLVLELGGVEVEILRGLQRDDDPVPVLLLVKDEEDLERATRLDLPFLDFLLRPFSPVECAQRVRLALANRNRVRALLQHTRDLEGQVTIDFKTGLLSERHFKKVLHVEFKRAQRHRLPLSLLLIDVDDFKSVNDSTEYAFGDDVLRKVAEMLRSGIRETDFAARFGGDEFVLLLPQTTPAEAVQTAIRIKTRIAATTIENGGYSRRVTVSIGIDTFDGRQTTTPEELRRRANKALQEAKRRGKNQVWLYSGAAEHSA